MTDEERQRTMDFIVAQQAELTVKHAELTTKIDRVAEAMQNGATRLDRDERVLKLMVGAGRRARRELRESREDIKALIDSQLLTQHIAREQNESIKRLEESVARNSEAFRQSNQAITELAEIVKQLATRKNGGGNS